MSGELKFKGWLVDQLNKVGLVAFRVEPRLGSDAGVPDLMVGWDGRFVPVECKMIVGGKRTELRATQKRWVRTMAKLGVCTWVVAGELDSKGRGVLGVRLYLGLEEAYTQFQAEGFAGAFAETLREKYE